MPSSASYRTHHLIALAGGSEQNLKRRLQKLFHGSYLDRVVDLAEARRYRTLHLGTPKSIYALANRGARHLENQLHYPPTKSRWDLLNRRVSSGIRIPSTLSWSGNFLVSLYGCIDDDPSLSFRPVETDALRQLFNPDQEYRDPFPWSYMGLWIKSSVMTHDAKGRAAKAVFYPDGFFVLQNDSKPKGKNRSFFFLAGAVSKTSNAVSKNSSMVAIWIELSTWRRPDAIALYT